MSLSEKNDDQGFMSRALQLAEYGRFTARPNPRVGCVIVKAGQIIAEGWHYRAGEAHAEVHALSQVDASVSLADATAYVTLEPCSHHGKTGPCAQALIQSGIGRVVFGMKDPNPLVAGRGLSALDAAGIHVDGPVLEESAKALNVGFVSRMQRQRPWVRCKLASSLDGRTAMASGESQWITGAQARQDVQRWRALSCAVVTGIGSIVHDDSRLTLRRDELQLDNVDDVIALTPLRVVLDTHLRIDIEAKIFAQKEGRVLVFIGDDASAEKENRLLARWPEHVSIERIASSGDSATEAQLDLSQMVKVLADSYQCNEVLVEAGATLSGAFLQAGLLDEVIIYQAPILLGSRARPLFNLPLEQMKEKIQFTVIDRQIMGDDVRITATVTA